MFNSINSLIGGKSSAGFLVSSEQIKYTALQSAVNKGDLESGRWLNSDTIFQKTPIFLGLQQHFVDGVAWDRTDYHELIKGGF